MHPCLRDRARDLLSQADILHDERIDPCTVRLTHEFERIIELRRKDDRIHGKIHLHAAQVRIVARFAQRFEREVIGASARIERRGAKIDRISSRTHRSVKSSHIASGR